MGQRSRAELCQAETVYIKRLFGEFHTIPDLERKLFFPFLL